MGSYRMFMCFTRKFRITEEAPPIDVKAAFQEYTQGGTQMTPEQLHRFLVGAQADGDVSMEDAEQIVEQVLQRRHHIAKFTRRSTLTLDDFFHYLFSADLNPPIGDKVHQDMTASLPHYFIYTGHNSYLTGNQLSSECSDIPIIKALKRGVRAVELDLWPNSTKDDVLVLHGWTLTTPVELIKCLISIKEHAFSASPYPVILTLEDHLSTGLQAKVAQMINQTFGNMVFYPESECLKEFPSPEELKYQIIISTKPPKEYLEAKNSKNGRTHSQKEKDSDEDVSCKEPSDGSVDQEDDEKSDYDKSEHSQNDEGIDACDRESQALGVLAYKRLIAIPSGNAKGGLKEALKVESNKVRRLSLREQKFEKATASYGIDIIRFTQKNLLRIYPKGTRVNSSNYKPLTSWMHGAQMVAFNMQGYGRSLWLMHGMFRANGRCGYVKKPDFLMNVGPEGQIFDPKAKLSVKKTLKVKVYRGYGWHLDVKQTHFNLWALPDFYTRVGIAGVPADKRMEKTKKKEDSWTPVWDEEFTFPLTVPDLALLRVEVHDYNMSEKDDFAGQTCLPVSELKPGIRSVPLFDHKGQKLSVVRLLMRFEFV